MSDQARTESGRYDLTAATAGGGRRPIDAGWSGRKKAVVGTGAGVLAAAALVGGAWVWWMSRPVEMPGSAEEALAVLGSARFERMDADRRRQYASEAGRLFMELSREERAELFGEGENREALRALREDMFDDMAYRFARGEGLEFPWGRRGGDGERRERRGPGGPGGPGEMDPERRAEMRDRFNDRMNQMFQSGNAQSTGLRGEMFQRMRGGGGGGSR